MSPVLLLLALTSQNYRLTGDALVLSRAPAGILALGGDARPADWVSAEALLWGGVGAEPELDALVAAIHLRHPDGWARLSAGRLIAVGGALRPVHLDGARGVVTAPFGTSLQAFGGAPVGRTFLGRSGDWLAGGRLSQNILGAAVIGLSFYTREEDGDLADRELGADVALHVIEAIDLSARVSYDLVLEGLSEVVLGGAARWGFIQANVFFTRRSAARILPATSLFTVLGDIPATRAGARVALALAPRLDVSVAGGLREVGGFGEELALRATLRLDDRGRGALAIEGRRDGTPDAGWWGARALARIPIAYGLTASTELELVVPDESDRGGLWPWGLAALGYRPPAPLEDWEFAAAFEAGASPQNEVAIDGLFRASWRWSE